MYGLGEVVVKFEDFDEGVFVSCSHWGMFSYLEYKKK